MEPENVIVEHLRAIRESIEANGTRIEANTAQLRTLVERVDGNSERLSAVEQAIVGYTAQITMFSRSLTVQMEARNRLEDKLDDALRRIDALESDEP